VGQSNSVGQPKGPMGHQKMVYHPVGEAPTPKNFPCHKSSPGPSCGVKPHPIDQIKEPQAEDFKGATSTCEEPFQNKTPLTVHHQEPKRKAWETSKVPLATQVPLSSADRQGSGGDLRSWKSLARSAVVFSRGGQSPYLAPVPANSGPPAEDFVEVNFDEADRLLRKGGFCRKITKMYQTMRSLVRL
jgi:hypothetical protein